MQQLGELQCLVSYVSPSGAKVFQHVFWLLLNKSPSLSLLRQAFCFMPALISSPVVSPLINWISPHSLDLQVFNNLIELVTSCGNYSQYRKRFSECAGFRFPILGVHLKDLIAVHVALPDWADKEKTRVNLTKTQQLYAILRELAQIQNTPPNIDANTDLLNLLTVSAKTGRNVYVRRPRMSMNDWLELKMYSQQIARTGQNQVQNQVRWVYSSWKATEFERRSLTTQTAEM